MEFLKLIFLALFHFVAGYGILHKFELKKKAQIISGSVLLGMFVHTIALLLLAIINIKITEQSVIFATVIATFISIGHSFKSYFKSIINDFAINSFKFEFRFPELITIGFLGYLFMVSYFKIGLTVPQAYDTITGIDYLAKFALLEGTFASSAYNPEIFHQPNYQACYAPFTALMQLLYRSAGYPFGQFWLFTLVIAGTTLFYSKLADSVHYAIAGLLTIILTITPEMFSYTFILQTDYPNAVFMCIGVIFFTEYYNKRSHKKFLLSTIFFALACFTRTETIAFLPFGSLMLLFLKDIDLKERITKGVLLVLIPLGAFALWSFIFLKIHVEHPTTIANQLVFTHYGDIGSYFDKMWDFTVNQQYWGAFFWILILMMGINLVVDRSFKGYIPFLWIAAILFTFLLLKIHIEAFNIQATYRRGLFKVIFIGTYFMGQLGITQRISNVLNQFEEVQQHVTLDANTVIPPKTKKQKKKKKK